MAQTAANLVEHALPEAVPLRQWVLPFPFELRARLGFDGKMERLPSSLMAPRFVQLPALTSMDVAEVLLTIRCRVLRLLARQGSRRTICRELVRHSGSVTPITDV